MARGEEVKRCVKHCELSQAYPVCGQYESDSFGLCRKCDHYVVCHIERDADKPPVETPWGWLFEGLDGVWYTVCMFQGKRFGQWEAFETIFDVGEDVQTCYEIKG